MPHVNPLGIAKGTVLYHTTSEKYTSFHDRPTWFTTFPEEADAYHRNTMMEHGRAITLKCEWVGGRLAAEAQLVPFAEKAFGTDEFLYSMFDERVGEFDGGEIRTFIELLKEAGFDGAVHSDYSAINDQRDSLTVVAFHPGKSVRFLGQYK